MTLMSSCLHSVIPTGVRPSASGWSSGVEEPAVFSQHWLIATFVLVLLLSSPAFAQELPAGWRRANAAERAPSWRRESPTRFFRVDGDFDGDGRTDIAELLINPTEKKFAIFVKLTSTERWQMLEHPGEIGDLYRFAIDLVKPGKYGTACGKGYDDSFCAPGEPDYLVLRHAAIDFVYTESTDTLYYWDDKTKSFHDIAMSD
jgi:hypothetical protein